MHMHTRSVFYLHLTSEHNTTHTMSSTYAPDMGHLHAEQQGHGQECLGGAKFDFGVGPLQAQSVSVWHYGRHPDG